MVKKRILLHSEKDLNTIKGIKTENEVKAIFGNDLYKMAKALKESDISYD